MQKKVTAVIAGCLVLPILANVPCKDENGDQTFCDTGYQCNSQWDTTAKKCTALWNNCCNPTTKDTKAAS
jgi:hypothetical protein